MYSKSLVNCQMVVHGLPVDSNCEHSSSKVCGICYDQTKGDGQLGGLLRRIIP